jgi:hypothetical protein
MHAAAKDPNLEDDNAGILFFERKRHKGIHNGVQSFFSAVAFLSVSVTRADPRVRASQSTKRSRTYLHVAHHAAHRLHQWCNCDPAYVTATATIRSALPTTALPTTALVAAALAAAKTASTSTLSVAIAATAAKPKGPRAVATTATTKAAAATTTTAIAAASIAAAVTPAIAAASIAAASIAAAIAAATIAAASTAAAGRCHLLEKIRQDVVLSVSLGVGARRCYDSELPHHA